MQSIATGITNYIASLDPEEAKAMKTAEYNAVFAESVRELLRRSPDAAEYLLAHVNAIYFVKDRTPRKSSAGDADPVVLKVVLDDSASRVELNAYRELLALEMHKRGFRFERVEIIPAKGNMRQRRLYPDARDHMRELFCGPDEQVADSHQAPSFTLGEIAELSGRIEAEGLSEKFGKALSAAAGAYDVVSVMDASEGQPQAMRRDVFDQARLLADFKKALILALGDIDRAKAVLDRIETAALDEVRYDEGRRKAYRTYWLFLYVGDRDTELAVRKVVSAYAPEIRSKCANLGLYLRGVSIRLTPEPLRGRQAFPEGTWPVPMNSYQIKFIEPREEEPEP